MRALILAAGEGQRLRPLTKDVPKPMVTVAGRPVLEHNVRLLARHGITEIVMNTHHRPASIVNHFGDGADFGVRITYSHESSALGTAGALLPVRNMLSSTFLVLYGDNLTTCNISVLAEFHRSKAGLATLAVFQRENPAAGGIVSIGDDDRIVRFVEKPPPDQIFSPWVNAGIMVCEPRILDAIPPGVSDFGKDVLPELIRTGESLFAYRMSGTGERLWWIDSPEDYARTKSEVQPWHLDR
ncbi:MAG TPA: nucleotidyltransferase family protein [Chthoniobacterales bacterium]|nr:nucleotidyltransferase family protein [Chthoniobacterales bacterium]